MINSKGNGIICDYCSNEYSDDFIYYSLDFKHLRCRNGQKHTLDELCLSVDLCDECMNGFKVRIKQAYKPTVAGKMYCDISGEMIYDELFEYYHCNVTYVDVVLSKAPYVCTSCNKTRLPLDGPCSKCPPDNVLVKNAIVTKDDKHLELIFSHSIFMKLDKHIKDCKNGII